MSEDLYGMLGVSNGASEQEIKSAYKKKARQYHPDVNKDSGAEATFKRIQKAYSILSDPQKKSQYDQFGVADDSAAGNAGGGFSGGFNTNSFEDIFDSFFGGSSSGGRQGGATRGDDLRYDLTITLEEAAKGISKEIDIYHLDQCRKCTGSGSKSGKKGTCSTCHGAGQIKKVQKTFLGSFQQVSTCPKCRGAGEVITDPCSSCSGNGVQKKSKKIEVSIPSGVDSEMKLRVTGEGNYGLKGGPAGDLYVFITVETHNYFKRDDDNVTIIIEVPYTQLILGTEIDVPTLTGTGKLKIPSGTQSGTHFRLKGKGLSHLQGYGKGDQYVKIQSVLPEKLSGQEKKLIEELSKIRGDDTFNKSSVFDAVKAWF
jgi:molecular chaperone DnaJ